ncbi:hypothetical protein BC332_07754 [Capsicum chinense]|nr:hypothetical protein BC332_07754 [Capsicum chinense]
MGSTNQDDADAIMVVAATSVLAAGVAIIGAYEHESSIPREPYVNKDQEREFYMNSILNGSDVHCAHSNHNKFINKKIKLFDEISLVCVNDRVRGDCAKSFEDIDFDSFSEKDNDNDLEGTSIEKNVQANEASQIKASRKRKCSFDMQDVVGNISIKFGEVATAIGRMVDSRLDVTKFYEEVMAMKGYNEAFFGDAFDYLVQSDTLAKAFMVKNQNIRKAHPNHDKFINKKIEIFDEMFFVYGNDRVRGDCAKSFEDIDFDSFSEKDNDNDLEGPSIGKDVQAIEASQIKACHKRKRSFEMQDVVGDISIKFRLVTTIMGRMVDSRLDVTKFYEEVMAMKGYNEAFFGDAFDYLVQSDTLAKAFMVKNQNIRKVWLE